MKRTLAAAAALAAAALVSAGEGFRPAFESLLDYRCPGWYRDAKFGIWSHWGPQAVPMAGDWYARNMYIQGHRCYQHHLEHYGHPSTNGWKDVIPLWKAEKWDPDGLMALYKAAGAKYFVSMGVHHDAFFLWDTAHSPWSAVKTGPRRDVVGEWQAAAKKHGLRFGVSEHLGASWRFYLAAHGADKTGPLAGVPYDGADPRLSSLYHSGRPGGGWYTSDPEAPAQWGAFLNELIDKYHPDLIYSDGALPYGETGLRFLAHFYNDSIARNGGRNEAVYTLKIRPENPNNGYSVEGIGVRDLERGRLDNIRRDPWQTDTSVGDWYYNAGWTNYRDAGWILKTLADVVSKNGNLLLNFVQLPDGTLEEKNIRTLRELAAWMAVNGEAIFATRPWLVHGEGPHLSCKGEFSEDPGFNADDIRYTKSKDGKTVYALVLGIPGKNIVMKRLALGPDRRIAAVSLPGSGEKVEWRQESGRLFIKKPASFPCRHVAVFKFTMAPESAIPAKDR